MSKQSDSIAGEHSSRRGFLLARLLFLLVLISGFSCPIVSASPAIEIHGTKLALANEPKTAQENSASNNKTVTLSPASLNLAKSLGLLPELNRWQNMKYMPVAASSAEATALKLELMESILVASYESRAVVNKINVEIAQANEINIYLSEQRDRALRINTYVNFISGGITRMVTGGLALGSVNHIAPDTLTAIEGVIQTSLATWGVYQLRGEKRLERSGTENMLTPIFDPASKNSVNYPASVWTYLNTPDGTKEQSSRRQRLLDHWYSHGMYLMRNKRKMTDNERLRHVAGTNQVSFQLTSDLLLDRMAMLTDLKTVVAQMDDNLLEILQAIRR